MSAEDLEKSGILPPNLMAQTKAAPKRSWHTMPHEVFVSFLHAVSNSEFLNSEDDDWFIEVQKQILTCQFTQGTLARVAEEAVQLWITEHPDEDTGAEMKNAVEKAVKEAKDKLQSKFQKEQSVANPAHGKAFHAEVCLRIWAWVS